MLRAILEVQPRMSTSGSGKTSDEIVYELSESILDKLPDVLDIDKASKELFAVMFFYCTMLPRSNLLHTLIK